MKILVALDGFDAAFNALRSACHIAQKTYSQITAFYVNKGQEYTAEETGWVSLTEKISAELETLGHKVINKAYEIGKSFGVPVEGIISYGIPASELLKYTDAHGIIKLIAMGHSSKGKGTQEFVESTTRIIAARSRAPVFITSSEIDIRKILIAVDNSEVSGRVASFGGNFAKLLGAELSIISVVPDAEAMISEYRQIAEVPNIERHIKESEKDLNEIAERAIFKATAALNSMGIDAATMIKKGNPSEEIIAEAGYYDLLVVGAKQKPAHEKLSRIANKLFNSQTINTIFVQ